MKLLIAIPSKGRADTIFKRTLRWVVRTGFDVRIFVEPQDLKAYREGAKDANYQNYTAIKPEQFVSILKNDQGLDYVRRFVKRYAIKNGYDLVFKMDDDVLRFNGRGRNKPDDEMIVDFAVMVGKCRKAFGRYKDVGAIGFPYRNELFTVQEWAGINMRLQSCYIIKPDFITEGFNHFDDFADYMNIRKQNKVTLRYGLMGQDLADVGKNRGGLQMFDREALQDEAIPKLREMHPSLQFKAVKGKSWSIEPILAGEFFGVKKL